MVCCGDLAGHPGRYAGGRREFLPFQHGHLHLFENLDSPSTLHGHILFAGDKIIHLKTIAFAVERHLVVAGSVTGGVVAVGHIKGG